MSEKEEVRQAIHEYARTVAMWAHEMVYNGTDSPEGVYFMVGCLLVACSKAYDKRPAQVINETIEFLHKSQTFKGEEDECERKAHD